MADRTFLDLEKLLAPIVPGCPTPTMLIYIRNAAMEVCERTLAWRYEQCIIPLTPGVYEYDYETPKYTEVCGVINSHINTQSPLIPVIQEEIHRRYPWWPSTDTSLRGYPRHVGQFDPDHFIVVPTPDNAETYNVKMFLALKPTPDSTYMSKTVLDEIEATVIHGAAQHLLTLPNQSWTDEKAAVYHANQFTFKLNMRRSRATLGNTRASVSVQMQPFC